MRRERTTMKVWGAGAFVGIILTLLSLGYPSAPRAVVAKEALERAPRARGFRPLRFAVVGDAGTGQEPESAVADRMCEWRKNHPYRLVVTTGDNVYPDGTPTRFDTAFYQPYRCLLHKGVRFRASLGNHDVLTRKGRPQINERAFGIRDRNYVIRKRGVRFVIANSNALKFKWLKRKTRAKPNDRWTIVVFHHPVYSSRKGGNTPGFRPRLPRLFRRRGVDLVLNGHDHMYSVSKRLHKIRYVVTGGGGAALRLCKHRWFTDVCKKRYHFLYIVAGRRGIRIRAVPPTGPPFTHFRTTGRK
ncbi:MAG: metallophosphoesterase [Actinomycetota bacterium]